MEFLLESDFVFLNHGSFGACPLEVHEEYQRLQRQLESQPVRFMQQELQPLLQVARSKLADFVGADHDDLVFVANPTYAVNEIARSLQLVPGDEVLVSDQEYGACHNAWRFMSQKQGFSIVEQEIVLPVTSHEEIVEQFWKGVTDQTKVLFLSHITSPTALTLPVTEICQRARERRIITVVDGAHAPGQIDLDLEKIGADFYTGTCHKWLSAPKGAAFLFARREIQSRIEPLIVGWGWGTEARTVDSGNDFLDSHEWLGTSDPSAYLTVPKAIEFQQQNSWHTVRQRCHQLAIQAIEIASEVPGLARVHPNEFFQQMALIEITRKIDDPDRLKQQLFEMKIEVPVIQWKDRVFVRISVAAYNTLADLQRLVMALAKLI
ncbi:MAG: aminotransferase class V-fold PLP-dependent enzyme [Planctomycetaceae bacterium]|nr:aminotransferase class V-fold PLP-dependent enzyme [Planctomycetaceae bacterium]